jgi:hypothetical protein
MIWIKINVTMLTFIRIYVLRNVEAKNTFNSLET